MHTIPSAGVSWRIISRTYEHATPTILNSVYDSRGHGVAMIWVCLSCIWSQGVSEAFFTTFRNESIGRSVTTSMPIIANLKSLVKIHVVLCSWCCQPTSWVTLLFRIFATSWIPRCSSQTTGLLVYVFWPIPGYEPLASEIIFFKEGLSDPHRDGGMEWNGSCRP